MTRAHARSILGAVDCRPLSTTALVDAGLRVETLRRQPAVEVSGTEMMASLVRSIGVATGRLGGRCSRGQRTVRRGPCEGRISGSAASRQMIDPATDP